MATTILTAKKAAREHRGRVLSSFFQQRLPDGQKTTNISLSAIRGWEADLNCQRRAILSTLDNLLPIEGGRREPLQEHLGFALPPIVLHKQLKSHGLLP